MPLSLGPGGLPSLRHGAGELQQSQAQVKLSPRSWAGGGSGTQRDQEGPRKARGASCPRGQGTPGHPSLCSALPSLVVTCGGLASPSGRGLGKPHGEGLVDRVTSAPTNPCPRLSSRGGDPNLFKPSSTSRPMTAPSCPSSAGTSSRSWTAPTPTGGRARSTDASASSPVTTSTPSTSELPPALRASGEDRSPCAPCSAGLLHARPWTARPHGWCLSPHELPVRWRQRSGWWWSPSAVCPALSPRTVSRGSPLLPQPGRPLPAQAAPLAEC